MYVRSTNLNFMTLSSSSKTIQFMMASQTRHTNVMLDEISSTPSLQRVLTDVRLKLIGINQSYWTKQHFKIDSGACRNLIPLNMYKSAVSHLPQL